VDISLETKMVSIVLHLIWDKAMTKEEIKASVNECERIFRMKNMVCHFGHSLNDVLEYLRKKKFVSFEVARDGRVLVSTQKDLFNLENVLCLTEKEKAIIGFVLE